MINVLYIHGMGGGADSRIPAILKDSLGCRGINIVVRTYSFDPETASEQISAWVEELAPQLVIGESLGSIHALRIKGIPHLLISPALNAPVYFHLLSWLALIPGVTRCLDNIYRPEDGDRQELHFTCGVLRKYGNHRKAAVANSTANGSPDYFHAFIGTEDHYLKSGIVSFRTWKKHFGNTFSTYPGSHFTEEEHIHALVIPKIMETLNINK